jgi:shikimate dehydrogenase
MPDKEISGQTKICALIGDPVEHTMSPVMHNEAYKKLGLDYVYIPFRVAPERLAEAVAGLRALNVTGFNVTIPHKVSIIPLLDGLDPRAEKIGAVNTVVNNACELRGYNTDAEGFLRALLERGVEPGGKNVVVLGAGGAARAITYILAERDAGLTILNRMLELDWAEDIAGLISEDFGKAVRVLELCDEYLAQALEKADILVNATSVGMSPASEASPVPARLLKDGLIVVDIVYNPIVTRLLREAKAAGARTVGGIDMLAWQGALAFEKWTGEEAPLDLMRKVAIKMLEKGIN